MRRYFFIFFLLMLPAELAIANSVIKQGDRKKTVESYGLIRKSIGNIYVDHKSRQEIFDEAQELSGYPIPEILPEIRFVSHQVLIKEACGGDECSRYAAVAPGTPILIDENLDLDKTEDRSFALHEAIHVLQFAAKRITNLMVLSCSQTLELEKEAYHLQQKYLDKHRAFLRVTWMIDRISCTEAVEEN